VCKTLRGHRVFTLLENDTSASKWRINDIELG